MKQNKTDQVATKGDLLSLEERMDGKLSSLEERMDKKAISYRDDVLNKLDDVMDELETIREEQILSTGQYRDYEERILKLEKLQGVQQ